MEAFVSYGVLVIGWGLSLYFIWELRGNLDFRAEQDAQRRRLDSLCGPRVFPLELWQASPYIDEAVAALKEVRR